MNVEAALSYARKHGLQAFKVVCCGDIAAAEYGDGFASGAAHALYSGTKSFWGVAAIYAQRDGILQLDEPVCETIPSWRVDPWKRRVTLRMLLSLTSGFGFGGLGSSVPPYGRALEMELENEPGTTFTYGGIPLQVFGAVLAKKVSPKTPHDYLGSRVLEPAGVRVASWRKLNDGIRPLPTGASLTADDWLTYGRYVLSERTTLAECFAGTKANSRYGLGWWLSVPSAPNDLFYASGSGGQALYVVPSRDMVAVHFGKSGSYKHETLLKHLFSDG